jgi:predicted signal transduction protein with EAL and GGDEF domain
MKLPGRRAPEHDSPSAPVDDTMHAVASLLEHLPSPTLLVHQGELLAANDQAVALMGGDAESLQRFLSNPDLGVHRSVWTLPGLGAIDVVTVLRQAVPAAESPLPSLVPRPEPVSDLWTRDQLLHHLHQEQLGNPNAPLAAVVLDIDQYAVIRQTLGFKGSDELMRQVSANLTRLVGGSARVALLDDETFCIAFRPDDTRAVDQLAADARDAARQPVSVLGRTVRVTASVGSSTQWSDVAVERAIHEAEVAKQEAGRRGGNRCVTYTPSLAEPLEGMMRLWNALRSALQFRQMEVWFQPIVSLATDRPIAAEALCRWHHPNFGDVTPGEFIPIAERNSEILNIGAFVQERAAEIMNMIRASRTHALGEFQITVNASANEVAWPRFAEQFLARIRGVGARPEWFAVELTQHALTQRDDNVNVNVHHLRDAGVTISLDDFGDTPAMIERLGSLPVDRVKISRQQVAALTTDPRTEAAVGDALAAAAALGLRTLAAGVETREQAATLRSLGCGAAQGFLFAPAVPDTELLDVLRDLYEAGNRR